MGKRAEFTALVHELRFRAFLAVLRMAIRICPRPERSHLVRGFRDMGRIRSLIRENVTSETKEFELTLTFEVDK